MMNLDYFKYCKELLIELEKAVESNDNFKIYQLVPSLISVVAITYYCLAEDIIITRDDNNPDINAKFKLNVPNSVIDKLFEHEEWMNISKKMTNSRLWLLSSIRNSIMHGASTINKKSNKLTINNKSFKNQLECEIDLEWFNNFLLNVDVDYNYISDNFSVLFTETIKQIDKSKKIDNLSSNYIYSNLIHFFKVEVKSKDNNLEPIPRNEIIKHIIDYNYKYINMLNNSIESDDELSLINSFKKSVKRKENETEDEFNARVFKHYFKKHLKLDLEYEFPNYEFKVNSIRPNCELSDLLTEDYRSYILKLDTIEQQASYASNCIRSRLLEDLLKSFKGEVFFRDFLYQFLIIDSFRQPEYISDSDMSLLLNADHENVKNVENNILKKIKGYNVFAKKTYDKVILRKIISLDFNGPDLLIASNLLRELRLEFDYFEYDNEEALVTAKKKCPYLFEKYTAIFKEQSGSMSDQDLVTFDNQPLDEISELKNLLNKNKKELVKMIIYLAGINCYVLNKELVYDVHNDIYDALIDDTFAAYSKTVYDNEFLLLKHNLDKVNVKIEKQASIHFSESTPQHVIDKYNIEKENLLKLKSEIEEKLNKLEIIKIDEVNMVKVDKNNTATLIRNSISHPGRIEILDDFTIKLKDFYNNSKISGVVFAPLKNLLNFFLNETFNNELENAKHDETQKNNK